MLERWLTSLVIFWNWCLVSASWYLVPPPCLSIWGMGENHKQGKFGGTPPSVLAFNADTASKWIIQIIWNSWCVGWRQWVGLLFWIGIFAIICQSGWDVQDECRTPLKKTIETPRCSYLADWFINGPTHPRLILNIKIVGPLCSWWRVLHNKKIPMIETKSDSVR